MPKTFVNIRTESKPLQSFAFMNEYVKFYWFVLLMTIFLLITAFSISHYFPELGKSKHSSVWIFLSMLTIFSIITLSYRYRLRKHGITSSDIINNLNGSSCGKVFVILLFLIIGLKILVDLFHAFAK